MRVIQQTGLNLTNSLNLFPYLLVPDHRRARGREQLIFLFARVCTIYIFHRFLISSYFFFASCPTLYSVEMYQISLSFALRLK